MFFCSRHWRIRLLRGSGATRMFSQHTSSLKLGSGHSLCLFSHTLACVCDVMFWWSTIITRWYISLYTLQDFNCLKCSSARMQQNKRRRCRLWNPRSSWNFTFLYVAALQLEYLRRSPRNTDAKCPEVSLKNVLWCHQTNRWNTTLWPERLVINSPDSHIRSGEKRKRSGLPKCHYSARYAGRWRCLVKFSHLVDMARKPETLTNVNVYRAVQKC